MIHIKLTKYTNTRGTFEAEWLDDDKTVRVIAYSGDQIDLFRADVAQYGGEVDEALLAEVQAEWMPPPAHAVVVPQSVTMRQARLALLGAGLLDDVDAAIAAIADPVQRKSAEIEWEYAQTVDRNSPFTQQLAAGLGLSTIQVDELFIQAKQL